MKQISFILFLEEKIKKINILIIGGTIKEVFNDVCGYSLDKEQIKVCLCKKDSILVVAGAGSGKSLTMIGKIKYLVECKKIDPREILCITFTNAAAKSLEDKINNYYNYGIKVYTFHKLSLEIIDKKINIATDYLLTYIVDEYFYILGKDMKLKVKKILGLIDYPYNYILNSKELYNLKKLIITFINLFKTNNYDLNYFLKIKKDKDIIRIIIDIYLIYESELRSTNSLDFNDMISLATKKVNKEGIRNIKYIIIDEYQDTSYVRYLLVKAIKDKTKAKLICVGDDYQSIYRFTGCSLDMFLNFKKYFKHSKILKINNTYRNSQELIDIAGNFIQKNKKQIYKRLKSKKHIKKPIKIMYGNNLDKLISKVKEKNILILGRNNFDIDKYNYKEKENIRYMTMHKSKGLEEDAVIIINLKDDILGIPNKIKDNKILNYINKYKENYPYEEERRLFYVAMTRTKCNLYLLVDKNSSIFVNEIISKYNKKIEYLT